MLRVLQVIGKMDRAGAETMIMNFYRNIDREKVQFDFLVFSEEEADYDKEIESLGGKIYHMPSFKGYNYFYICHRLKKFFEEHSYDIVHGHIGSPAPAYLSYAKRTGSYTIAHSHAPNSTFLLERMIFTFFAYSVRYIADYYFACSTKAGLDRFGENNVNSDRFQLIRNAINGKDFIYTIERQEKLKEQFGLSGKKVIGHVGRFAPVKNHRFLIEVFDELQKKDSTASLVLVGDGAERQGIEQMVCDRNLKDKVRFLGIRDDIADMMNLFDAFIFPSKYEGLGNVGIEAQAAGLPCFYSSAIPDEAIITDNVWKYDLNDGAEAWADHILETLHSYERKNTYNNIADAGFDIEAAAKQLQEFYLNRGRK